jgi:hypothetical protein
MRFAVKSIILLFLLASLMPAQTVTPTIARKSENASQVGLYEKYEITLNLEHVTYANPYNPEEIDVRALFTAPSGRQWSICGFYDNYQNRNQWKVRFAANEIGTWTYSLSVTTPAGTGNSAAYSFVALASKHHGWLHTASANTHYLVHDDGSSFYGVSVFWPWKINNSTSGLGALQNAGCNLVGFWNVTYDDNTLIESLSSGLGRYDQNKCNRIDTILEWMEQRDMVLMLSIWPHDLFCLNMPGWAALWNSNPYNQLCKVQDIYANETAWSYQEKQYRYIIARWGHSRGLGLWEIINEINGTDAWANGRISEAEQWTRKVHAYLHQHDPYRRPTTASMSGGQYWPNGYAIFDLPNVHMYETGWTAPFKNNPLRSSLWTYHNVTRQLWEGFSKPAIMGEAGWLDNYGDFAGNSDEYVIMFHNALWSSWSSGLACSPVWWAFDSRVMGSRVLERMQMFSRLAPKIDYARSDFRPVDIDVSNADAFAMADTEMAFGWTRDEWGRDISQRSLQIRGLRDSVYSVQWYDTWQGVVVETHIRPCLAGILDDETPLLSQRTQDLAFIIKPVESGTTPARLGLMASPRSLFCDGQSQSQVRCLVFDSQGRFCSKANSVLNFSLTGLGRFVTPTQVTTVRGMATIAVQSEAAGSGTCRVIATSPGLEADTVSIVMSDVQLLENFEDYGAMNSLNLFWKVRTGTFAALIQETKQVGAGMQSLRIDYGIGDGKPPYAGFFYTFPSPLKPARYVRFWLSGDGSNRDFVVLLNQNSSTYWESRMTLSSTLARWIELPLADFVANDGTATLELARVTTISFNVLKGNGGNGSGTLYIDEISFANSSQPALAVREASRLPVALQLSANYPNPFNAATEFEYFLPKPARVKLYICNMQGQLVDMLVDEKRAEGSHHAIWQAIGKPSGTYVGVLSVDGQNTYRKCLLLK